MRIRRDGADVAGEDFLNFFALIGVHLDEASDAFAAAFRDVKNAFAGFQLAGVDADEAQLADERVGHDLEDQRGERRVVFRLAQLFCAGIRIGADHRRNVERRGQQVAHGVEHVLNALVLEGGTTNHREDLHRDGRFAKTGEDFSVRDLFTVDEFLHQNVIRFRDRLDHLFAVFVGLFDQIRRNFDVVVLRAQRLVAPDPAFIVTRSTILLSGSSQPPQQESEPELAWRSFRRSTIVSTEWKKSAPTRSILLMKQIRGTSYLSA